MASPRHRSPSRSSLLAHPCSETCPSPNHDRRRSSSTPPRADPVGVAHGSGAQGDALGGVCTSGRRSARRPPTVKEERQLRTSLKLADDAGAIVVRLARPGGRRASCLCALTSSSASLSPLSGLAVRAGKRRPARTHQLALRVERMPSSDINADVATTDLLRTCWLSRTEERLPVGGAATGLGPHHGQRHR
jgi:hypothetical protein